MRWSQSSIKADHGRNGGTKRARNSWPKACIPPDWPVSFLLLLWLSHWPPGRPDSSIGPVAWNHLSIFPLHADLSGQAKVPITRMPLDLRSLSFLSCWHKTATSLFPLALLTSPKWDTCHTTHSWGEQVRFVVWDSLWTSEKSLPDKIQDIRLHVNFRSPKNRFCNASMSYMVYS